MHLILLFSTISVGCGPDHILDRARNTEKDGQYQKAWELYQEFAAKYPKHPAAAEALFRAGWLAQKELGDCVAAKAFYSMVVQEYPQSGSWASQAAYFKSNCPDYFPLLPGYKWTEGDSETRGHNARIEVICKKPDEKRKGEFTGQLEKTFYAGSSKFKTINLMYKKTDTELLEFPSTDDPRAKSILQWPFTEGAHWSTKFDNKTFQYKLVAVDKKIKVEAGEFANCLQVQSSVDGYSGATNEYYAPDVGRILVTFSTDAGEKRNTELISYESSQDKWDEANKAP